MKFVTFTENEKINISSLDKEHVALADALNKIYSSFTLKKKRDLKTQIGSLLKLLRQHFDNEEKLMKETNFFGYYSHKLEHDRFYKKIDDFAMNKLTLTSSEFENLRNWFYNHIEISDKKCGEHFVKMGIK